MEKNKNDFGNTIKELDNLTGSFKQYVDAGAYEDVATRAKELKKRIDEANEQAREINHNETLVEYDDTSDYTMIA